MQETYDRIIECILSSGRRLTERTGKIADIGITKKDLTEEDIRIERDLKAIIEPLGEAHSVFAEEENDNYAATDHVWVIDPISGTSTFINGLPHYGIVLTHIYKGESQFAVVYDPSVNELFTAYRGEGAFLNGEKIEVRTQPSNKVILAISSAWHDPEKAEKTKELLSGYDLTDSLGSMAVNYCQVACGRYDGLVSMTKDAFPDFAGCLIVNEAGGKATNFEGDINIRPSDRTFIAGTGSFHQALHSYLCKI